MRSAIGLVLGALCAVAISCAGGARKSSGQAPPPSTDLSQMQKPPRAELDELDRKIDQELAAMGVTRPAAPLACSEPSCSPQPMTTGLRYADDPTCKPGPSEKCRSSCTFSDSICHASARICELADELAGDAYAKEKCESGTRSCQAARAACCGCQL